MRTNPDSLTPVILPANARRCLGTESSPPGMTLLGCAPGALALLSKMFIAIIGCGSVGGRIAINLARMGIGQLLLVDPKNYKANSLVTHEISPEEVGQPKAKAVARRCQSISPHAVVHEFPGPVESLDLTALADADLVVMAPDLLTAETEVGQRCLWLGKPLIQASVHGATLTVQIRFFQNAHGTGACPVCGYGRRERDLMIRQVRFSCEGPVASPSPDAPATQSISALCSLAADLAVLQMLRFFLGLGQPVADTMAEYCGFTHRTIVSPLNRNPKCTLDHTALTQVVLEDPLSRLSLAAMAQKVTGSPILPETQFEVAGYAWVEFAACQCSKESLSPVGEFVPCGQKELSPCLRCKTPRLPHQFYSYQTVSASLLGSSVLKPLCKLGARRVPSVVLRTADSAVLIRSLPKSRAQI